jgi:hypothetical protein
MAKNIYKESIHSNYGNKNYGCKNTGNENVGNDNTGSYNDGYDNTGEWNYGSKNSGYDNNGTANTGCHNEGDRNAGDRNLGNHNAGDYNKANYQTGYFNTKEPEYVSLFNKPILLKDFKKVRMPLFFSFILHKEVPVNKMTKEEKKMHPEYKIFGYYTKRYSYKEAWANAWKYVSETDIKELKALPNYDHKVFTEITGIKDKRLK